MRQRVVIALALCAEPELIIADEPTTALDVSVQAQIIALLKRLGREHGTAIMLVTHDMGVIAETADRVAVMYAGRIAEIGPVREVVQNPLHPYAKGLMGAIPSLAQRCRTASCRSPARCRGSRRSRPAAPSTRAARTCSTAAASSGPEAIQRDVHRVACHLYDRVRQPRSHEPDAPARKGGAVGAAPATHELWRDEPLSRSETCAASSTSRSRGSTACSRAAASST